MLRTQESRKTETRRRLLDAAAELFADHGVDAVSVDAVAERAGRTSGAVYAHFGSKQGLLLAILDDWSAALVDVVDTDMGAATNVRGRMAAVWDGLFGQSTNAPRQLLLLEHELWIRALRDPEVATIVRRRYRDSREVLARGLERWARAGDVDPPADPEATAFLVKALILGIEMQLRLDPGCVSADAVIDHLQMTLGAPGTPPRRRPVPDRDTGADGSPTNGEEPERAHRAV